MGWRDKMRNMMQSGKGKTKEATGEATGDPVLRAEGKGDQVSGDLKQAGEKVKDAFDK